MNDRELMQQALEALEEISGGYSQNLIVALRERLAQPEQKPVASWVGSGDIEDSNAYLAAELFVVAQQSPADDGFSNTITRIETWLKNHFSTPSQRKPLSEEEIQTYRHMIDWTAEWSYINFARAIEAAHGIKGDA